MHQNRPWLSQEAILYLDKHLDKNMTGLEYGSGRSTIYFARKLKKLVSIEHHTGWFNKVDLLLKEQGLNNVEYLHIPKENTTDSQPDDNVILSGLDGSEPRMDFYNYYSKVNEYPDEYFDFVLIDGRARVHCGKNAINKLKSGGIFVLDNSERARYKPLHDLLSKWPMIFTTTGLTDTTIWTKP